MSRPRDDIPYTSIITARAGARSKAVDVACPVCGPQHKGASAQRKVMRTWALGGGRISFSCARCGAKGWLAPDSGNVTNKLPEISSTYDDEDEARKHRNAEAAARIWKETYPIAGTAGWDYFVRRGIDLSSVPDHGRLRWHLRCPW